MRESKVKGHEVNFGNTLGGLIRKGWWEIPEIMGASCFAILGIIMGTVGVYNYIKNDGDNREFKKVYMIMRPDDKRVPLLKNPVFTEYK